MRGTEKTNGMKILQPLTVGDIGLAAGYILHVARVDQADANTALLQEIVVDAEGTTALSAQHPFLAQLALRNVLPNRADQLRLLIPLVASLGWDPKARRRRDRSGSIRRTNRSCPWAARWRRRA